MARTDTRNPPLLRWRNRPRRQGVKATDHAYVELRRAVLSDVFKAGQNYLQNDIADMLGISRTPSREAIIRLECDGLLQVRPRHGICIPLITVSEIEDIHGCLAALEGHAVRMIIDRREAQDCLVELEAAQSMMERAAVSRDMKAWVEGDRTFHDALILNCGNQNLYRQARLLWDRLNRLRVRLASLRSSPTTSIREHAAVIRAIRRGDAGRAHELQALHHQQASKHFTSELARQGLAEI